MENPANVNNAEELGNELRKMYLVARVYWDDVKFNETLEELVQEAEYWKEACRHVLEVQS